VLQCLDADPSRCRSPERVDALKLQGDWLNGVCCWALLALKGAFLLTWGEVKSSAGAVRWGEIWRQLAGGLLVLLLVLGLPQALVVHYGRICQMYKSNDYCRKYRDTMSALSVAQAAAGLALGALFGRVAWQWSHSAELGGYAELSSDEQARLVPAGWPPSANPCHAPGSRWRLLTFFSVSVPVFAWRGARLRSRPAPQCSALLVTARTAWPCPSLPWAPSSLLTPRHGAARRQGTAGAMARRAATAPLEGRRGARRSAGAHRGRRSTPTFSWTPPLTQAPRSAPPCPAPRATRLGGARGSRAGPLTGTAAVGHAAGTASFSRCWRTRRSTSTLRGTPSGGLGFSGTSRLPRSPLPNSSPSSSRPSRGSPSPCLRTCAGRRVRGTATRWCIRAWPQLWGPETAGARPGATRTTT